MAHTCNCVIAHKITQERVKEISKAAELVEKIRLLGGLVIKDRSYHFKSYKTCFVASELVDWFVSSGEVESRAKGVELGQLLVDTDYIHHVVDEHYFEDAYLFFRFRLDEPLEKTLQDGPSVAYMKGQEGALISSLARKRRVLGWAHYLFVLVPNSKRIYQYRSELDSSPLMWVDLVDARVQPESPRDGSGRFIMHITTKTTSEETSICLAADSSDTRLTWLTALQGAGIEILPEAEDANEMVQKATSIFDFEVKTIDGNLVDMSKYRGHVTLIVNVASQ